jgi:hypothetical protein
MPKTSIKVKLTGKDGNVFNLAGIATNALRAGGYPDLAKELQSNLFRCHTYDAALSLICDYVEVS